MYHVYVYVWIRMYVWTMNDFAIDQWWHRSWDAECFCKCHVLPWTIFYCSCFVFGTKEKKIL